MRTHHCLVFGLLVSSLQVGCAHLPLARNARKQANTLNEIQQQQVLDNLAMFAADRGATPFFATPTAGSTQVAHGASAGLTLVWDPRTLTSQTANAGGTAGLTENWTLSPVNNPDKLKLMKCVYHTVLGSCDDVCLNCNNELLKFFGADYPLCETPSCWFSIGGKRDVPKGACHVGRCGDLYVWVLPGRSEYLSRTTMAILDIATIDDTILAAILQGDPSVEITESFDEAGNHSFSAKYTIPKSEYAKWYTEEPSIPKSTNDIQSPLRSPSIQGSWEGFHPRQGNTLDSIRSFQQLQQAPPF